MSGERLTNAVPAPNWEEAELVGRTDGKWYVTAYGYPTVRAALIIAGTFALYETPYRPGDWITVDGVYGEVKSIEFRTVNIVTPDDTLVLIPHSKLWDSLIHNANNGSIKLQCVASLR